jgi:hypothetical protein
LYGDGYSMLLFPTFEMETVQSLYIQTELYDSSESVHFFYSQNINPKTNDNSFDFSMKDYNDKKLCDMRP